MFATRLLSAALMGGLASAATQQYRPPNNWFASAPSRFTSSSNAARPAYTPVSRISRGYAGQPDYSYAYSPVHVSGPHPKVEHEDYYTDIEKIQADLVQLRTDIAARRAANEQPCVDISTLESEVDGYCDQIMCDERPVYANTAKIDGIEKTLALLTARYDAIADLDPIDPSIVLATLKADVVALQAEAAEAAAYHARLDAVETEMLRVNGMRDTLRTLQSKYEQAKCDHAEESLRIPPLDTRIAALETNDWANQQKEFEQYMVSSDYFTPFSAQSFDDGNTNIDTFCVGAGLRFEFWAVLATEEGAAGNQVQELGIFAGTDLLTYQSFQRGVTEPYHYFIIHYRGTAPDGLSGTDYNIMVFSEVPTVGVKPSVVADQSFWGYRTYAEDYQESVDIFTPKEQPYFNDDFNINSSTCTAACERA